MKKIRPKQVKVPESVQLAIISAQIQDKWINVATLFIKAGGSLFALYFVLQAINGWFDKDPALAQKLIDSLNLGNVIWILTTAICGAGWAADRFRAKRAIKKKGYYQNIAEKDDTTRESSGLNEIGETPHEEAT